MIAQDLLHFLASYICVYQRKNLILSTFNKGGLNISTHSLSKSQSN